MVAMGRRIVDKQTGRTLIPAVEAAKIFGCSKGHLALLGRNHQLSRHVFSARAIFYELEQVKQLAEENAQVRKQRGGRPRSKET
jgi:hypothetical protein